MSGGTKKTNPGGMILQHFIAFAFCIVFPGLTTFIAPASWLTYERKGASVDFTARTCVYFIVPFKTQRVTGVNEISSREREGRTERKRRHGRATREKVYVDGEGFLQVYGANDQMAEVSVSPASLESVVKRSNAFLSSAQQESLRLFAIANWKFGALMGGVLTLFTVLYVVGYTLGFLKLLLLVVKRLLPGDGSNELRG